MPYTQMASTATNATNATCTSHGDGCLRVQTDSQGAAKGFLTVGLDQGEGLTWPHGTGQRWWPYDEEVINQCFVDGAALHSVLLVNPDDDGWSGSVEYKAPGECEFRPLRCVDCLNVRNGSSAAQRERVWVDGSKSNHLVNFVNDPFESTLCLDGWACTFVPDSSSAPVREDHCELSGPYANSSLDGEPCGVEEGSLEAALVEVRRTPSCAGVTAFERTNATHQVDMVYAGFTGSQLIRTEGRVSWLPRNGCPAGPKGSTAASSWHAKALIALAAVLAFVIIDIAIVRRRFRRRIRATEEASFRRWLSAAPTVAKPAMSGVTSEATTTPPTSNPSSGLPSDAPSAMPSGSDSSGETSHQCAAAVEAPPSGNSGQCTPMSSSAGAVVLHDELTPPTPGGHTDDELTPPAPGGHIDRADNFPSPGAMRPDEQRMAEALLHQSHLNWLSNSFDELLSATSWSSYSPSFVLGTGTSGSAVLLADRSSATEHCSAAAIATAAASEQQRPRRVVSKQIFVHNLAPKQMGYLRQEVSILKELSARSRHVVRYFDTFFQQVTDGPTPGSPHTHSLSHLSHPSDRAPSRAPSAS